MNRRAVSLIRDYLPQLAGPASQQRSEACAVVVGTYKDKTQELLYQLLANPDLTVRQQAALALRAIDEWAAGETKAPATHALYIRCLGPLHIFDGHREIRFGDWAALQGGRAGWLKVLGIFAYLVDRGRAGATRAEIGDAVWNGPVSSGSLSRTLSTLRQTLAELIAPTFVEQALIITPERCSLSVDSYLTDAQIFERLFNVAIDTEELGDLETAAPFYSIAVNRCSGLYMEGLPYAEDTFHEQRHRLLNIFVIAIERLAEHFYKQEYYRYCISLCQRALEFEPASEEVTIWLLRAWDALQMRGELEHAYRAYLRAIDVDPMNIIGNEDEVIRLHQNLNYFKTINE